MNHRRQFHHHRVRRRGNKGSPWTAYDPYWLEAEHAYSEHCDRFPERSCSPRIIEYPCREEFLMPVTREEVRATLARVPAAFQRDLQAVFLLAGTRTQLKVVCGDLFSYGFYWADCIFLHPFPLQMLCSVYRHSPKPSDLLDYARVGAEITTETDGTVVRFDRRALKKLYLQDVLIHEIGHHVDRANLGHPKENEAYARWFATEFGFRRTA